METPLQPNSENNDDFTSGRSSDKLESKCVLNDMKGVKSNLLPNDNTSSKCVSNKKTGSTYNPPSKCVPDDTTEPGCQQNNHSAEDLDESMKLKALESKFSYRLPGQHYYRGIMLNSLVSPQRISEMDTFEVRSDDIIVSGYPKSGTTWLEEIVYLIQQGGDLTKSQALPVYVRVPFLEGFYDKEVIDKMTAPRLYKSHLSFSLLPPMNQQKSPKIIHIMRNPKDTVVSYFHFYRSLDQLGKYDRSWSEFLDMFMSGYVCCGDWFSYAKEWWQHRNDSNVLIIHYEEMKRDPHLVIANIANFCDKPLDQEIVDKIAQYTSFDQMKENPMLNFSGVPNIDESISSFMRKGQVGDWKNHFTVAQNEAFDRLHQEELGHISDLYHSTLKC